MANFWFFKIGRMTTLGAAACTTVTTQREAPFSMAGVSLNPSAKCLTIPSYKKNTLSRAIRFATRAGTPWDNFWELIHGLA